MKGIYLVTDQKACQGKSLESIVLGAIKAGVSCVQLREKNTGTRLFLKKAQNLSSILKPAGIPLIINDRVDIALAAKATGVHLGQSDMPYEHARKLMGPGAIIGLSVETWEDVQKAQDLDVDYLGVSPVFLTPTKTDTKTPWGLGGLEKIRNYSCHPLVAIGGLDTSNAQKVIKAGADAVAVVSAICSAKDAFDATTQLVSLFEQI
ncbi:thiamine phosphate synthase [Desulfobacula sp.]|uniref:thiamine phosphate synthase n=1 Tax=Desulfobacula sp. TaxID=2593537 RepID=UPI0026310A97|nr:thiamine phosphate synthase [Desulfobacula sp.]